MMVIAVIAGDDDDVAGDDDDVAGDDDGVAGDAGRRSGGQGAGRRALLPDLLCKALYIFLSLL